MARLSSTRMVICCRINPNLEVFTMYERYQRISQNNCKDQTVIPQTGHRNRTVVTVLPRGAQMRMRKDTD